MTITINLTASCEALSLFTDTVFPSPIEYKLGAAGFDLPFLFETNADPGCTFPIVYELSEVPKRPNMLTVNDAEL